MPTRVGTSAVHYTIGLTAAMLVMDSLLRRQSSSGEYIDISLFEVATTWNEMSELQTVGKS